MDLTRHALEHTRERHSQERKPGLGLPAKKPPDQRTTAYAGFVHFFMNQI